jgi:rubrerythrin
MVHKIKRSQDYLEAIEGEGWAIVDYQNMISNAKTEKERKVLTHIMNEEQEHLKELMGLLKCEV